VPIITQWCALLFLRHITQWCALLLLRHINNLLSFITYLLKLRGVLPKPTRKSILYLGLQTPWVQLFWFKLLEGYCSCPEVFNSHAPSLFKYPIKPLGSITYLLEFGRVLQSPSKT
jgi:hypothetical protein